MLILAERVVGIGNLDPVARREQIQVEYVLPVGLIIEAVEDGFAVAYVVEGGEFRRIQEAAAAHAFQCQEVADLGISEAEPRRSARGAERAVGGVDIAKQPRRAPPPGRGRLPPWHSPTRPPPDPRGVPNEP